VVAHALRGGIGGGGRSRVGHEFGAGLNSVAIVN